MNQRPITFLNAVWGSARSLLNQDLDNYVPDQIVDRMMKGLDFDGDIIRGMTMESYRGSLLDNHNPVGRNPWILPTTVKSNERRRGGLQFCPLCLTSDPTPYFRRKWRIAFVTTCTTHGVLLRDRCPKCDVPVHQHRTDNRLRCWKCNAWLCAPETRVAAIRGDHVEWQRKHEASLETGWAILGDRLVRSPVMFAILRQVAALLVNGPKATALRSASARTVGGSPAPYEKPTRRQPFEYLDVAERHRLFDMVERLMQGWPIRFVDACQQAGLRRSHAIKDMPSLPFEYEMVMRGFLDMTPYYSTDEEVAAAAAWLKRTKGRATYADLKSICGENRSAIYRHMDYIRTQKAPSRYRLRAIADTVHQDGSSASSMRLDSSSA